MIHKLLAQLILDNPEDIQFFLQLISQAVVDNKQGVKIKYDENKETILETYKISGLLNYSIVGNFFDITLKTDDHWIIETPEIQINKGKDKKHIPEHLTELGLLLGLPIDWHTDVSKYIRNYYNLSKIYSRKVIDDVCDFAVKNNPKIDLNMFLTKKIFTELNNTMILTQNQKPKGRVSSEDYSREQFF